MKPEIAPTSPKNSATVADVWKTPAIQRPPRIPWGKITLTVIVLSIVLSLGVLAGSVWLQRHGPVGWWSKWLPGVGSTTIIQQTSPRVTNDAPRAVQALADSIVGLAVQKDDDQAYGHEDVIQTAVALSDNGWLLTLQSPPASDASPYVAIRPDGEIEPITIWIDDPASVFFFAKAGTTNDAPATFGDVNEALTQTVWIIRDQLRNHTYLTRRVVGNSIPAWPSSDLLERVWLLDAPVDQPGGLPVANATGQLIGLLDQSGQVYSVSSIQPIIKDLVQTGRFERTYLGLRARPRAAMAVPGDPTAGGWLVGAGEGQTAIEAAGPADRAGVKSGDIILKLDGQVVGRDLFDVIQRWQPGEVATVTVNRDGNERELTVEFSARRP